MITLKPLYQIFIRMVRKCQSLIGMPTLGARAIIIDKDNKVLLVKHTYMQDWYLPGGGVKKGESIKTALFRELQEEVGVTALEEPVLFGIYHHVFLDVNDYPIIYVLKQFSQKKVSSYEIEDSGWFEYSQSTDMVSAGTKRRLMEYFEGRPKSDVW